MSNLNWECEELSEAVTSLDLDISMNRKLIMFQLKAHVKKRLYVCTRHHNHYIHQAQLEEWHLVY